MGESWLDQERIPGRGPSASKGPEAVRRNGGELSPVGEGSMAPWSLESGQEEGIGMFDFDHK